MIDLDGLLSDDSDFFYGEQDKSPIVEEVDEKEPAVKAEENIEITDDKLDDENTEKDPSTEDEPLENSPNLVYLNLLTEKGIMPQLDDETLTEFKNLGFEEQTEKLLEFYDTTVLERANTMVKEYVSEWPTELKLIEENYKNGMDVKDAIKYALEAPAVYNPTFDTERDEALEKKLIVDEYLRLVGGDQAKAEILFSFDFEKGVTKDRAIEISRTKHEQWTNAQREHLATLEQNNAKQIEMFNENKRKYSEFLKGTEELLPNLKISAADKSKLFDARFKPVQTDNGITTALDSKISSNPEQANAIMAYLFVELDILNKPANIEKLYKVGKTIQTKSVMDTWKNTNAGITNKSVTKVSSTKKLSDYDFS